MENHSFSDIIGTTSQAPYINSLASECGLATNYHNLSHPSLPNYVGATSGLAVSSLTPFDPDCNPTGSCLTSAPSIFGQGETWKAYEESMPSNCAASNSGDYAVRHNPPPYFTSLTGCSSFDVPFTQLATDLSRITLPAFSFVTPNLIDDMHDGTIADGDTWLSSNLPTILNSPEYTSGSTAVFITWDEGTGGSTGENCSAPLPRPGRERSDHDQRFQPRPDRLEHRDRDQSWCAEFAYRHRSFAADRCDRLSPGQTLTYSATGLPAGLSVNSATGLISGTPTTTGTFTVTVTATDTTGASGSATFSWRIRRGR